MATREQESGRDSSGPKDRLYSSDFIFATLANLLNALGLQMLVATLPLYVLSLGGSKTQVGLVIGATGITALLLRPFVGWLTDVWRRRPVVLMATACYASASLVYLLAGPISFLVLGRMVSGFGTSGYSTASNAYVADIAPSGRRAEAIGFFSAAQAFGLIIGPIVGFLLVGALGFRNLFYFTAGLSFLALLISFLARERRRPQAAAGRAWSIRSSIVAVECLPISWTALCLGMGFGAVNAFIAIFSQQRGLTNPGFYFTVQAIALLVSRIYAGRLADRHGRKAVIVPGIVSMTVSLALLPLAQGLPFFTISAFLCGLGFGMAQPATMALLIDQVLPERRGLASNTYLTGYDVGYIIGSLLMGLVCQQWGFGVMWILASLCTLLGLAGILPNRIFPVRSRGPLVTPG